MLRRLATLLLLLLLAVAGPARGAEVAPRQRALLLLRVLTYDRALAKRAAGTVTVAVVFRPGADATEAEALLAAFEELSRTVKAAGLPVRAVAVPYEGPAPFAAQLARLRPVALYGCANLGEDARTVALEARAAQVLAMAGERRQVVDGGFALALVDRGARAGLVVDREAAVAAGADLDSALLSVAELVQGR
ncbi:MAG: hypothetical protein IPO09_01170 [Anaeromyxobacter sp.]|nr:hypothetical protein [Anaeromyxobacter sp.]MBL0278223.1 hypothetical protein [Anaeromyxobacter sp.]